MTEKEAIERMKEILHDLKVVELQDHMNDNTLYSWVYAWREEMQKCLDALEKENTDSGRRIKAVVQTELKAFPTGCSRCRYRHSVCEDGDVYLHCRLTEEVVERYFSRRSPNCPLVGVDE